ncbi:xanthine dehydrogenase family protein [candidate division KSB1 bacterium]|nr:xanthine dehydrogenase family protein [candidate division KSB1 bacterium]MBL7094083.1 xanthine dehydrogenase family protein [candidate division KSB1 bacterium]
MKPNPKNFRVDAAEKLHGKTQYIRDEKIEGLWYGATIRSPYPRARIKDIQFNPDFDWDTVTVVTAKDILNNYVSMLENDMPFLADKITNYYGEAIVILAGPKKDNLDEAKKHIKIQFEELPAILDMLESETSDVKIFGTNNLFKDILIKNGDLEVAKKEADEIVHIEVRTGFQEQMYMEPQGIVALPEKDRVVIRGSIQCPYYVKGALDTMFDGKKEITVIHVPTGGAFGGKEDYPSIIAGHAALLAVKSGHPVAFFFDREEDIQFTTKRHPSYHNDTAYVTKDGKILGLDIQMVLDSGAYCTLSQVVLARAALTASNCYYIPNIRIRAKAVATNIVPPGAFRGFGGPQAVFAIEMLIEKIANQLDLSPVDVRRKNLIGLGQQTPTGQILKYSVSGKETFEDVLERSDFEIKYLDFKKNNIPILEKLSKGEYPKQKRSDVLRGIGIAPSQHGAGFTGTGENVIKGKIRVEINKNGQPVIYSAQTEMGQGEVTAFQIILSEALQIRRDDVIVAEVNTDFVPNSGPTVASRSTMVVGSLLVDAANEIIREFQNRLKENGKIDFEYRQGYFYSGEKIISFKETAKMYSDLKVEKQYEHPPIIQFDDVKWKGDAYPTYSWAAAVAEVEVDPVTFEIKVTKFYTTHEIGKAINYDQAVAQIQGGSLQGIGYALYENIRAENGKFNVQGFSDYIIPTTTEMPDFEVSILENPYPFGPFGAKGLGELPLVGAAPAVVSALWMIFGREFNEIPVLPEDVFSLFY